MADFAKADLRVGDLRRATLTVSEAAVILETTSDKVRKSLDRNIVEAQLAVRGKRQIRLLNGIDVYVMRLKTWMNSATLKHVSSHLKRYDDDLTIADAIDNQLGALNQNVELVRTIEREAFITYWKITYLKSDLNISTDGLINGTSTPAHRIAALVAGGMGVDEVLVDYPNLSRELIDSAVAYARLNPKQGRPYPKTSVKSFRRRSSGEGGGLNAAFAAARLEDEPDE